MRVLEQVPEYVITVETPHEHSTLEQMLATRAQMVRDGPQLMIASLISRDCLPHQFETVRAPRLGRSSIHACMQVLTMARPLPTGPRPETWPLFECRVTHTSPTQSTMHFCISLFIMDGVSDLTMRRQLSILYEDPNAQLPPCSLLYKDYCLSLTGAQHGANGSSGLASSAEYQAAKAFWWGRVPQLPPPPELPMLVAPGQRRPTGEFSHIGAVLSAEMFSRLKARCAARGVTPTSVMLTIYCLVLARFARHPRFLLNILHCLRHPVHEDVSKVTPSSERH